MKCLSCDVVLTDHEATRKYEWGEFIDLCDRCLDKAEMGLQEKDNEDDKEPTV